LLLLELGLGLGLLLLELGLGLGLLLLELGLGLGLLLLELGLGLGLLLLELGLGLLGPGTAEAKEPGVGGRRRGEAGGAGGQGGGHGGRRGGRRGWSCRKSTNTATEEDLGVGHGHDGGTDHQEGGGDKAEVLHGGR